MNLVNVGLLGRKGYIIADLVSNGPEELIIDKLLNNGMLVGRGLGVLVRV
jgi:hypothetical protein